MNTDYDYTDHPAYMLEITEASRFLNEQDVTISLRDFDAVKKLDALLLQTWPDIAVRLAAVEMFHSSELDALQYYFKQRAPGNDVILSSVLYSFKPELV